MSTVDSERRCAEATLRSLVAAFNDGDDVRLSRLVGTSIWGSLTLPGSISTRPEEAVAALLTRSRAGERWSLTRFDFNGRGWDGALHFGLVVRRTAPDLPSPFVDSAGKGALDCPAGRVLVLGLGTGIPPRVADAKRLR